MLAGLCAFLPGGWKKPAANVSSHGCASFNLWQAPILWRVGSIFFGQGGGVKGDGLDSTGQTKTLEVGPSYMASSSLSKGLPIKGLKAKSFIPLALELSEDEGML